MFVHRANCADVAKLILYESLNNGVLASEPLVFFFGMPSSFSISSVPHPHLFLLHNLLLFYLFHSISTAAILKQSSEPQLPSKSFSTPTETTPTTTPSEPGVIGRFDMFALTDFQAASHRLQRIATRQLLLHGNHSHPGDIFASSITSLGDIDKDQQSEFAVTSINPSSLQLSINIIRLNQPSHIHLLATHPFPNAYPLTDFPFPSHHPYYKKLAARYQAEHYHQLCPTSLALVGHRTFTYSYSPTKFQQTTSIAIGVPCHSGFGAVFIYSIDTNAKPTRLDPFHSELFDHETSSIFVPLAVIPGIIPPDAKFGTSVAHVGDINGDGFPDLVIGAPGDSALFTVFLDEYHTNSISVIRSRVPSSTHKGFGSAIAPVGDLNDDGIMDLVVSSSHSIHLVFMSKSGIVDKTIPLNLPSHVVNDGNVALSFVGLDDSDRIVFAIGDQYDGDSGSRHGAVWIVHIENDGTVENFEKISATQGNLDGLLENGDHFGAALAITLDDSNKDGSAELLVGVPRPPQPPEDSGLSPASMMMSSKHHHYQQKIEGESEVSERMNVNNGQADITKVQMKPGGLWILDLPGIRSVRVTKLKEMSLFNYCIFTPTVCSCSFRNRKKDSCLTLAKVTNSNNLVCHKRYCSSSFECGKSFFSFLFTPFYIQSFLLSKNNVIQTSNFEFIYLFTMFVTYRLSRNRCMFD